MTYFVQSDPNLLIKKTTLLITLSVTILMLGGCQTIKNAFGKPSQSQKNTSTPISQIQSSSVANLGTSAVSNPQIGHQNAPLPNTVEKIVPPSFAITGKIGVTYAGADGKRQAGSAFYAWGQENERFAVDLTGALGIGATTITYNGKQAILVSEKTGEIRADNPESLLYQATGWYAPISQLPFWVMGQSAPNDDDRQTDEQGRLINAKNHDWQASFDYEKSLLPSRLRIVHTDGHRVVLSINNR